MKVAVVEDDYAYRTMLSEFLEDQGYEVIKADAPEKLKGFDDCDAFIMDVSIPPDRMAGINFICKIQIEAKIRSDAMVVFISNFGRDSQEIEDRLARVTRYEWLDKPVNLVTLAKLLKQKLAR